MAASKHFEPAYLQTLREGRLEEKAGAAEKILEDCTLCPRSCKINRAQGEKGHCRAGYLPEVSSYAPHFGEERPLVGRNGSGTIFFTHCNLGCTFCQNYSISHLGEGRRVSFERLAEMMLELQALGCHNINFVTPTHYVPQILKSVALGAENGLSLPLVYNTSGYDGLETIQLLEGVFDIYMPDIKFSRGEVAEKYCHAPDYPQVAKTAVREMQRQCGDLVMDERGIALHGLLVRHLVLPSGLAGTAEVMHFLAAEVSTNVYINIMDQYHPWGEVRPGSPLSRNITVDEYREALAAARREGLHRFDMRNGR